MKFEFIKKRSTKTMGLRLRLEDYDKISRLAKKYNTTKVTIASEIIRVGLKETK